MLKLPALASVGLTLLFSSFSLAEGIVEAHIKAVGGNDAIAKIKTVHRAGALSGNSSYGPLNGTFQEIADLSGNRGYTSMQLAGFSRSSSWTGDSGWASDTQAGVTDLSAEEVLFSRYSMAPSPLAAIHAAQGAAAIKEGGERKFNGKKCTLVTVNGAPIEFYVNQETKLLEGATVPGNFTMTLDEYKPVNGVRFAGKLTVKVEAKNLTMVYEYATTTINGKVDAAKFKRPDAHSAPAPSSGLLTAKQLINSMDANGDGKIGKDEAPEQLKTNFQYLDTNGDGTIDENEAQVMMSYVNTQAGAAAPAPAAAAPVTAKQLISSMDTNSDGKISKNEASEDLKLFFADIDVNADGGIDVKEAQAVVKYLNDGQGGTAEAAPASARYTAKQLVSFMDANGDGKISKDEASEELKPYFAQYDTNGDSVIDVTEAQVIANYLDSQSAPVKDPEPAAGALTAKQIIGFMDANGDGKISKDEASDELKPNFQYVDSNGDGTIDLKEAQVMADYANQKK